MTRFGSFDWVQAPYFRCFRFLIGLARQERFHTRHQPFRSLARIETQVRSAVGAALMQHQDASGRGGLPDKSNTPDAIMLVQRVIQDCNIKVEPLRDSDRLVPGFGRHNFVSSAFHQQNACLSKEKYERVGFSCKAHGTWTPVPNLVGSQSSLKEGMQ